MKKAILTVLILYSLSVHPRAFKNKFQKGDNYHSCMVQCYTANDVTEKDVPLTAEKFSSTDEMAEHCHSVCK